MKCADFHDRLQELIDQRVDVDSDQLIGEHAAECAQCCDRMIAWRRIHSVVSPKVTRPKVTAPSVNRRSKWIAYATVAAALLFTVGWQFAKSDTDPSKTTIVAQQPSNADAATDRDIESLLAQSEAADWWAAEGGDWVAQTMPAVRNVRKGMAPLGRSLLQAVTILTIGGGDQHT